MHPKLDFIPSSDSKKAEDLLLPMFEIFSEWEDFYRVIYLQQGTHRVFYADESGHRTYSELKVQVNGLETYSSVTTVYMFTDFTKIYGTNRSDRIKNLDALNYLDGNLALRYPNIVKA